MKRLLLVVAVLGALSALAIAQSQIEDRGISPTSTPTMYWQINQTGGSEQWTNDSAAVDTSAFYKVVPGLYYTVSAVCDNAADTITQLYVYRNTTASVTGGQLIDSFGVIAGTTVSWRDIHGGSAGLKYPVMARYLYFIMTGDATPGAGAGTIADVKLISSVVP